ncbi:MAG: U32 family peptidase [Chitinispirillaceae bacterium]|jgi:putative protease|nr:U32 family peptidase [Chitinispirillaceae bacterium]
MKPELLSPAGSIESFHAAIEAGADAIYLGLDDFNARLRAKNFTSATLSYLLPYAHKNSVKLYVTLNTQVKQNELEPAIHTLYQLEHMGVDAVIIADFGLVDIARKNFPGLVLHASTQMVIHNSAGIRRAGKLGLRRAVLARELTLEEISSISKSSSIELELFVHGALCYSVSGLCLASSFLGGSSGNRGRCTQFCRRSFCSDKSTGSCFSPRDFQAIDALPQIIAAGITSLKIEGRMKNPEYVYTVTRAYRMALDAPSRIPEAKEILSCDFGRNKTTLFLNGMRQSGIIDALDSGIGVMIGTVLASETDKITLETSIAFSANDRIRIQPASGYEGEAVSVRHVSKTGDLTTIIFKKQVSCSPGDKVYLIGRHAADLQFDRHGVDGTEPVLYHAVCPFVKNILSDYSGEPALSHRDALWIKTDTVEWLDHLHGTPCQHLIFAGDCAGIEALLADRSRFRIWKSRLVIAPPAFIPEDELDAWQNILSRCADAGITQGCCSNIGHASLFGKKFALISDSSMNILNSASQKALLKNGFVNFTYSIEDDYLNVKASVSSEGIACLFARPQLFVSRIKPAVLQERDFIDPEKNRFSVTEKNNLFYCLPEKPFAITHRRNKLSEAGIHEFMLDLSFVAPDQDFIATLIDCYRQSERLPGSGVFNFKAGLK